MSEHEAKTTFNYFVGVLIIILLLLLLACKPTRTFRDGDYQVTIEGDSVRVDKIEN